MLRPILTPLSSPYPVPWAVARDHAPKFTLTNTSDERLHGITLTMLGSAQLLWGLPRYLDPGSDLTFRVIADDPARDAVLIVRWFRPIGTEYLWRVSF